MGLTIAPDTTYPEKYDATNARWTGVYTFLYTGIAGDDYPVGGEIWSEPVKFFKTITQLWFENEGGYILNYDQEERKLIVYVSAGTERGAGSFGISGRWVLEGRQI